jgi:hypothetical protein
MRNLVLSVFLISGLSVLSQPATGALLSTYKSGLLDGMEVRNGDVVSATAAAGASGLWVAEEDIFGLGGDGLPQNLDIDALAMLGDGRLVLSVDAGQVGSIGGLDFGSGDLVAFDPSDGTAEMFLSGAELGVGDIDAVHVRDNGRILMSFSVPEVVSGLPVKDGDIYEYDPESGTGWIFLYEEEVFSSPELDVSGLSIANGKVLLSTREDAVFVSGYVLAGSHVAQYDPATGLASEYLNLEGRTDEPGVDAVAFIPECGDGIDNDGDGLVDVGEDVGCPTETSDVESPECQDGLDNDGNLLVDFDGGVSALGAGHPDVTAPDPSCSGLAWMRQEGASTSCGLGFEAAILLLPLMWLHASRRRRAATLASDA